MSAHDNEYDLLIIGGGINGAGIAADASGRGLKVLLCEQNDLASATSSNSSKLIHGGLRYLENYQFRLVREALREREVLLKKAPHIIWPLSFRLPHQAHLRSPWMIRMGLFIYDHLAWRNTLPASKAIEFNRDSVLNSSITQGFEYADGWVDDARLVILNAQAAHNLGATIATRTRCIKATRNADYWDVTLEQQASKQHLNIKAKSVVNAAGPWVASLFEDVFTQPTPHTVRLVKGSHIVVPRIHSQPVAYILQNEDNRIVFVIPYEQDYSLIGTTDEEYSGDIADVKISEQEIEYLISITNHYFKKPISEADIVHTFSGVRPLLDDKSTDAQAVTRDYKLILNNEADHAPLLSVFGGKITTYRKLAENAVNKLAPFYPKMSGSWTKDTPLPGGDFSNQAHLIAQLESSYPWLPIDTLKRMARSYGTLSYELLGNSQAIGDLGYHFGHGLYAKEVDYLVNHEWAKSSADILWRRTKLGLRFTEKQVIALGQYLTKHPACHN
ncbi:Aerobic glycerol-3-phosphate dehydrogenase [Pseudoalteromonas sp. P1-16-1b]|uniref:glycerol-3-phosphate dehydrogenase n=1 Tax=Pseudoalteromonas TaxID=53246 RepID=UPI0006BAA81E|nr:MULTISPECIES: glycerol-3-phosphate dehydrogenase [Pseudoalteromonas]KPH89525.1 glycerol-3-phosphate dehydrogenase [Pseudoalteromonas undina]KPZ65101.1 Aerobic glycerol-3-phosphate dehydrogenase [Pseudoalteromonas sp. P1-16-1b]